MADSIRIAIIDDEQDMRQSISQWLELSGHETETFASAEAALKAIGPNYPGIVISDIKMPGMDGMALLKRLMSLDSTLPVIMITGHGDVAMAVAAMQMGAYDFLEKPFNPDRLTELARRATEARRLTLDNRALRRELADGTVLMRKLMGTSQVMERLREDILDLAQADSHVLIEGETGTGKTLVANALHACGPRAGRRFVTVNCAAHDEETLVAQLFGPAGEGDDLPAIERARGGTLCLEDCEALPARAQGRLLTLLNDEGHGPSPEVRVIAICNNHDAERACEEALRPDLFFRLAAMKLDLPPLRVRGEDILILFNRFSEQFAEEYGCAPPEVTASEAAQLLQHPWPGNVRQLINTAERSVLQSRRGTEGLASLLSTEADTATLSMTRGKPLKDYVEAFERMLIDNTMRRHKGSIAAVMEELGLPRRTLNEKMAKYGLSRSDYL